MFIDDVWYAGEIGPYRRLQLKQTNKYYSLLRVVSIPVAFIVAWGMLNLLRVIHLHGIISLDFAVFTVLVVFAATIAYSVLILSWSDAKFRQQLKQKYRAFLPTDYEYQLVFIPEVKERAHVAKYEIDEFLLSVRMLGLHFKDDNWFVDQLLEGDLRLMRERLAVIGSPEHCDCASELLSHFENRLHDAQSRVLEATLARRIDLNNQLTKEEAKLTYLSSKLNQPVSQ